MPPSSRTGGCTFPEDPGHGCTLVLPVWSAEADPRVLAVRAVTADRRCNARLFDMRSGAVRTLASRNGIHLLIERGDDLVRLDLTGRVPSRGPVSLRFDIADDGRLDAQLAAIRAFCMPATGRWHARLAGRLRALHAIDARNAGASLRGIADRVLGPGEWPGDGEHRKSAVRRLLVAGDAMVRAGPRAILGNA